MGAGAATMKIQPVEAIVQLVYSLAEIIPVRMFGFFWIQKVEVLSEFV